MKRLIRYVFLLVPLLSLLAQKNDSQLLVTKTPDSSFVSDANYKEDQFYFSITYNLLGKKPDGVSQSGFSSGFHLGVIKDMPLNERRNVALGLGLGLSSNSYNQSLLISKTNNEFNYGLIGGDVTFSKNKFTTYVLELPIEFRWRTSTASEYDFWRIYSGVKFGYIVYNSSKFSSNVGDINLSNIDDFNRLQYGLTLSVGYSNVNFYIYYALNNIFNGDIRLENTSQPIEMNAIKIGLIFYVL